MHGTKRKNASLKAGGDIKIQLPEVPFVRYQAVLETAVFGTLSGTAIRIRSHEGEAFFYLVPPGR